MVLSWLKGIMGESHCVGDNMGFSLNTWICHERFIENWSKHYLTGWLEWWQELGLQSGLESLN